MCGDGFETVHWLCHWAVQSPLLRLLNQGLKNALEFHHAPVRRRHVRLVCHGFVEFYDKLRCRQNRLLRLDEPWPGLCPVRTSPKYRGRVRTSRSDLNDGNLVLKLGTKTSKLGCCSASASAPSLARTGRSHCVADDGTLADADVGHPPHPAASFCILILHFVVNVQRQVHGIHHGSTSPVFHLLQVAALGVFVDA